MELRVWQFAALFAMALLGATHLTGYEWLRFFTYYGSWGTVGLLLSAISMVWISYKLVSLIHQHELNFISDLFQKLMSPLISPTISFLFYTISFSYIGSILALEVNRLREWVPWSGVVSALIIGLLFYLLLHLHVNRLSRLIAGSLIACIVYYFLLLLKQRHIEIPSLAYQFTSWWWIRTLFFIAAHLFLSLMIILPAARIVASRTQLLQGIWIGGGLFTLMALLCHGVLLTYWHDVNSSAHPFALISSQLFTGSSLLYHLLSFIYSLLYIGIWTFFLTHMVAERFDLRRTPVRLLVLLLLIVLALVFTAFPWMGAIPLAASAYVGAGFLLILFRQWKRL